MLGSIICITSAEKLNLPRIRGISSVGLERMLDRHEVGSSNLPYPTKRKVTITIVLEKFYTYVLYSEAYSTKKEALKRERQLKTYQGRKFIRKELLLDTKK